MSNQVEKVIYSAGQAIGNLPKNLYRSTTSVEPNITYKISVEILQNRLDNSELQVNKVMVDGVDLGKCTPEIPKYDCAFVPCSDLKGPDYIIRSETGVINIAIEVEGHSWGCYCDTQSWRCSKHRKTLNHIPMVTVGKIKLAKQASYNAGTLNLFLILLKHFRIFPVLHELILEFHFTNIS